MAPARNEFFLRYNNVATALLAEVEKRTENTDDLDELLKCSQILANIVPNNRNM